MPLNRMLVDPIQTTDTMQFTNENSAKTDTKERDIARVWRMFFKQMKCINKVAQEYVYSIFILQQLNYLFVIENAKFLQFCYKQS
jgi:hypothetical protein